MAKRRRPSETTCREDALSAGALAVIAGTLASRHPDILALKMAEKLCGTAQADLTHQANGLAAKTPPAAGALLEE